MHETHENISVSYLTYFYGFNIYDKYLYFVHSVLKISTKMCKIKLIRFLFDIFLYKHCKILRRFQISNLNYILKVKLKNKIDILYDAHFLNIETFINLK